MNKIVAVLLLGLVCLTASQDNYNGPSQEDVVVLDSTNLQATIYGSTEPWLLDLYAHWCGHCITMRPQLAKLATRMKGKAKIAKIDASLHPQFNQMYGLGGYPHLVFIPQGKKDKSVYEVHSGSRTADALEQWINQKIQEHKNSSSGTSDVIVLDNTNLESMIFGSKQPWLLDLYAEWCGHCVQLKPTWSKLATRLKGKAKVATIDAAKYPQFNQLFKVTGYPTIVFIPQGQKERGVFQSFEGSRNLDRLQQWTLEKIQQHKAASMQRLTNEAKWSQSCETQLCVIVFLPHLQNSSEQERQFFIKMIQSVVKNFKDHPVSVMWTQAGDHPELQRQFSIVEDLPKAVMVNSARKQFSVMESYFTEEDFDLWLRDILSMEFRPFSQLSFGNVEEQTDEL